MDLHEISFVVVDVETTGGSPARGDRVTEVAAVHVDKGEISLAFTSLVNPERPIPWHITQLTGISDDMVAQAPTFADVARELADSIADRVFVAHNARFDHAFLNSEFARVTPTPMDQLLAGQLCTVKLARRILSHLPRRNLDAVTRHYGVQIDGRHRAAGDAIATAEVLRYLLKDALARGVECWDDLERLLGARTSRAGNKMAPVARRV